nr:MAG TPA_asm: hypothetical protein [Bacteriophage sp.]
MPPFYCINILKQCQNPSILCVYYAKSFVSCVYIISILPVYYYQIFTQTYEHLL